jgi:hypothetical protein
MRSRSRAGVSPVRTPTSGRCTSGAEPLGGEADALERGAQVAVDVDRERPQRGDVDDAQPLRFGAPGPTRQPVDAPTGRPSASCPTRSARGSACGRRRRSPASRAPGQRSGVANVVENHSRTGRLNRWSTSASAIAGDGTAGAPSRPRHPTAPRVPVRPVRSPVCSVRSLGVGGRRRRPLRSERPCHRRRPVHPRPAGPRPPRPARRPVGPTGWSRCSCSTTHPREPLRRPQPGRGPPRGLRDLRSNLEGAAASWWCGTATCRGGPRSADRGGRRRAAPQRRRVAPTRTGGEEALRALAAEELGVRASTATRVSPSFRRARCPPRATTSRCSRPTGDGGWSAPPRPAARPAGAHADDGRHRPIPALADLVDGDGRTAPELPPRGDGGARARLEWWFDGPMDAYDDGRNDLAADGTSKLSHHLHLGCHLRQRGRGPARPAPPRARDVPAGAVLARLQPPAAGRPPDLSVPTSAPG